MMQIDEQQILTYAPNPAAAANGKKISQHSDFVRLECSADNQFYRGECKGSGKSNYTATIDFVDRSQPVFRCSCPSRQFPCKHSLALLYELLAQKPFAPCEIPEDILQKRAKKQARAEKNEADSGAVEPKKTELSESSKSARAKKLKKQLEGLDLTAQRIADLLSAGLGSMGGTSLASYRQLAKRLGDYYLPGPQRYMNALLLEIDAFQRDGDDTHYDRALDVLKRLRALIKKSQISLAKKLENGDVGPEDNYLYEELGGVWKLTELAQLGLAKQQARLAQLAFWIAFDKPANEYIDTACWIDLTSGEIDLTKNYRPVKALKHVKQEDSFFGVAEIPLVCYYPGDGNRRIRWERMTPAPLADGEAAIIRGFAAPSVLAAAKEAKNLLKNILSTPYVCKLLHFSRIGMTENGAALQDPEGNAILLGDMPDFEETTAHLELLPERELLVDQVLLGAFYYDAAAARLKVQPLSIVTPDRIVRLLY